MGLIRPWNDSNELPPTLIVRLVSQILTPYHSLNAYHIPTQKSSHHQRKA